MPVPEGKEIYSPNPINLDPGVNSDEEEDMDNIFRVCFYILYLLAMLKNFYKI